MHQQVNKGQLQGHWMDLMCDGSSINKTADEASVSRELQKEENNKWEKLN